MCIAPVVGVFLFAGLFKIAIAGWMKVDGPASDLLKKDGLERFLLHWL